MEPMFIVMYLSRSCLKEGISGKSLDSMSLKLKVATRSQDPKLLANAMRSYPWEKNLTPKIVQFVPGLLKPILVHCLCKVTSLHYCTLIHSHFLQTLHKL
jgi:hypothetical protein